jgi:SAM-dependent methyltransferase
MPTQLNASRMHVCEHHGAVGRADVREDVHDPVCPLCLRAAARQRAGCLVHVATVEQHDCDHHRRPRQQACLRWNALSTEVEAGTSPLGSAHPRPGGLASCPRRASEARSDANEPWAKLSDMSAHGSPGSTAPALAGTEGARLLAEASRFYWYHCVELAPGIVTDGDYEMAAVWPAYRFPEPMAGLDVLDVGRGSGHFAFEFERRGARVVATDIESISQWDWGGGEVTRATALAEHLKAVGDEDRVNDAFHFAHRVRSSSVVEKTINVYDLDPAEFDGQKFDLVFAGSLASHLRDPILAFERLWSVTKGTCIVAAPSIDIAGAKHHALMCLVPQVSRERRSWWVLNAQGLVETLRCAGFSEVEIVGEFTLECRRKPLSVKHLVAHAKP